MKKSIETTFQHSTAQNKRHEHETAIDQTQTNIKCNRFSVYTPKVVVLLQVAMMLLCSSSWENMLNHFGTIVDYPHHAEKKYKFSRNT